MSRPILELPVDAVEGDVRAALEAHRRPVVVTAPTGSGKSTRLPVWLASATRGRVMVVQPRRVACRGLAPWVAEQMGTRPGDVVGWHIRGERRESDATRVLFVTPGMALRRLADPEPWAALLVDEFHERSWDMDLLVALARAERVAVDRIVLTSATLAAESLRQTLDADLIVSEGRSWPVNVTWDEAPGEPTRRDLAIRVAHELERWCSAGGEGDVLVFLPGRGEIADASTVVSPIARRFAMDVVAVHGGVPLSHLRRALAPSRQRRVYLATNVAETSLTLPGVRHVIDSGLERRRTHRGSRTALALMPIAADAMAQRTGRAGRVAAGTCRRLFSRRYRAAETTPPEVTRMELDEVVLHAARCGLAPPRLRDAPWVTPPPEFALERALNRLTDVGAIDSDGLTSMGTAMADWPTSPMHARLIVAAVPETRGFWCDVVAWLEARGQLWRPLAGPVPDEVDAARRQLAGTVADEVRLAVLAIRHGEPNQHRLDEAFLSRVRMDAQRLRAAVGVQPTDPVNDRTRIPEACDLAVHVLSIDPSSGYVERARSARARRRGSERRPWVGAESEIDIRWLGVPWRLGPGEPVPDAPVAGAVLDVAWLGQGATGLRGVGSAVLPCGTADLASAGLGEEVVVASDPRSGQESVEVVLGGVVLAQRSRGLRGDALRRAAVERLREGRWLLGVWDGVEDALHVAAIIAAWPAHELSTEVRVCPTTTADEWLDARLEEIGVEEPADLSLIEKDDLLPDLVAWTGLPVWDVESFVKDFPRVWVHLGAQYRCHVRVAARRVSLEPVDRTARRVGEPAVGVVPSFRGFRVEYRFAGRVVPIRG